MSMKGINRLTPDQEAELKIILEDWWLRKDSQGNYMYGGMEIAKNVLGFGDPNIPDNPYIHIPPDRIYYYRMKLGIEKRDTGERHPHRYKYGKQDDILDLDEFIKKVEGVDSLTYHHRRKKAGVALGFWGGARNSENRMLTAGDFEFDEDPSGNELLRVNLFRLKKGKDITRQEGTYPIELRTDWTFVPEIIAWIEKYDPKDRPWNVSRRSWLNWHKEILGKEFYPHYLRNNTISVMCSDPRFSIAEIRNWTGLHLVTIENYISKSRRFTISATEKLDTFRFQRE